MSRTRLRVEETSAQTSAENLQAVSHHLARTLMMQISLFSLEKRKWTSPFMPCSLNKRKWTVSHHLARTLMMHISLLFAGKAKTDIFILERDFQDGGFFPPNVFRHARANQSDLSRSSSGTNRPARRVHCHCKHGTIPCLDHGLKRQRLTISIREERHPWKSEKNE